jgi:predicted membrane channel-forming protein YqfA (hemolysin III family)
VLRGYRAGGTYARCLASLFEFHTETLNAWTMVWGSVVSVALLAHALGVLGRADAAAAAAAASGSSGGGAAAAAAAAGGWHGFRRGLPGGDAAPFWVLTASTLLHCPFSVGFHLFRGMSPRVYNLWRRLDQVFIYQVGALPWCARVCAAYRPGALERLWGDGRGAARRQACPPSGALPPLFSALPRRAPPPPPAPQASQMVALALGWFVYRSAWGLALNVGLTVAAAQLGARDVWRLGPGQQRPRHLLLAFFGAVVACWWAPMGVQAVRDLAARAAADAGAGAAAPAAVAPAPAAAGYAGAALAALALGGAAFAAGFPERLAPGAFDIFGFSHQLMHLGAIAAHVFEFLFVIEMMLRRRREAGLPAP